ncbi:YeiH family protein [Acidaminobacter sp.]|uniref:YeiH family protein n=1 Tax=Acidaminobacter sp. TaxID=1872102 RepID=UPI0013806371|nr:YeiH family protein [Acidaminobacter sp.]MDK9711121.1 YeiH family protein [Acidaminobacter sp.]MZQ97383.1 putative sulfate exporter family transporter [Acidaminobacter sp.]
MKILREISPGVLLCFIIAMPAWFLGKAVPVVGSPVFGILAGMMLSLFFPQLTGLNWKSAGFEKGIKMTSKKLLQLSIILLGFGMNLFHVFKVGSQSIMVILVTLSASFVTAYFVGKTLSLDGKVTTLIGVGTSICGGSAIAATAPVIEASDEEVAHAISTIFLFNVLAVFIFPTFGRLLGLSDMGFGMWAGTAINDTSSVVAAGTAWSSAAGNDTALAFATIVKLTRTLMIVPITLVLAIYTARKKSLLADKGEVRNELSDTENFNFVKVFPWFVIGFLAAAVVNTVFDLGELSVALVTLGKFLIVMAMAAIGLNTKIKKLLTQGLKPVLLGICCWIAVAGASLLVQSAIRMW